MKTGAVRKLKQPENRRGKIPSSEGRMTCPKCRTTRGLYRYELVEHNRVMPTGLSCFVCGYWMETGG